MTRQALTVFAVGLVLTATPSLAQNLLENGSFDTDISGWEGNNQTVELTHMPGVGSNLPDGSGPGAVEVRYPAGDNGGGALQFVDGLPNTDYVGSASVLLPGGANGAASLSLWLYFHDSSGGYISHERQDLSTDVTDVWQTGTVTATSPPGTERVGLMLGVFNYDDDAPEGWALWDDAILAFPGTGTTSQVAFLAAAADTPGLEGTYWTTDGWVSNLSGDTLTLSAAFLGGDGDNTGAVSSAAEIASIPPGGTVSLSNLVAMVGGGTSGGLYLRGAVPGIGHAQPLMAVTSYTATPAVMTGGSFGQGIPGVSAYGTSGDAMVAAGAVQNEARRTNVGVLNTSDRTLTVEVAVFDSDGDVLNIADWTLAPYQHRQRGLPSFGVDELDGGMVRFRLLAGSGTFSGYLSSVDAVSGDAIFVAAR